MNLRSSCYGLGSEYAKGKGVPKDWAKAVQLFKKACDGGSTKGCRALEKLGRPRS